MVKIFIPSIYREIKKEFTRKSDWKSLRLTYICLWAWVNIAWRKMFFAVAKKHNFEYLGEKEIEAPDGSLIKVPIWYDSVAHNYQELLVLNPHYYPNVFRVMEIKPEIRGLVPLGVDYIRPNGFLNEKNFLKIFPLKRTNFINALHKLKKKEFIDLEIARNQKGTKSRFFEFKHPLIKFDKAKIKKEYFITKQKIKEKGYDKLLEESRKEYAEKGVRFPMNAIKIINEPWGRIIHFPLIRIVQIPLNILTKKDLKIAERITAIELYRMKKEEELNMIKKGNKTYVYLGKERITEEDLAQKIGFSKPIIIDTLKKLWY